MGSNRARNEVGILVDNELVDQVIEVKHKSDRVIAIKIVVGSEILNAVSIYAFQIGLAEDIMKQFWEELDLVIQDVPQSKKLSIGGDFNGHISVKVDGYDMAHGNFCFGERNNGGVSILDFAVAYELFGDFPTSANNRRLC